MAIVGLSTRARGYGFPGLYHHRPKAVFIHIHCCMLPVTSYFEYKWPLMRQQDFCTRDLKSKREQIGLANEASRQAIGVV